MVSTVLLVIFLVVPLASLACEGDCIVNTTKEFLRLYTPVTLSVLQNMADKIDAQMIPPANRHANSLSYFDPVLHTYHKAAYKGLEHAIFPSYFHGKCLNSNGTVPNGCPNPDCPVVCGTPGSMVHFYPTLTRLVFNQVSGQMVNITSPKSKAYKDVQKKVLADALRTQPGERALSRVFRSTRRSRREKIAAEKRFRAIMKELPATYLATCGGSNLSQCSWDAHMKPYILQFP